MIAKSIFDDYKGIVGGISRFGEIITKSNIENYGHLTDTLTKAIEPRITIADIVGRNTALYSKLNIPSYQQTIVSSVMEKQWNTLAYIANASQTPEISSLKESLIKNDFSALQVFADSLKAMHVEAANLALLKVAPVFDDVSLPKGISTAIRGLHAETAKCLLNSKSVSFNTSEKKFFVEKAPENSATVSEINILCSSTKLFSGIDEADLIMFLTHLEEKPDFASEHETGQRIRKIISEWNQFLDFDQEYFYHARHLEDNACPYTARELGKAPAEYVGHGRYNHIGRSHYYFSDMEKGAILEVRKHAKGGRVQIAKLHPTQSIRLIDLSEEIVTPNKFLEYCRFEPDPEKHSYIKREYLLPCFVAGCCKQYGIEGIKYYGSKEYKNYVSWNDGYFDVIDFSIK